ncbi:MAG TPA: beta-propeller domain-containing protein [Polyangiaceae bacterium]|nr:beta-propeller domain-containing protein [Polyangiaceae bacterium]
MATASSAAARVAPVPPPVSASPSSVVAAPLPPPPIVTAPLPGEPTGAALAQARLVTSGCDDLKAATDRAAAQRVREMQRALDAELRSWAEEQPDCWRTYRETGEAYGRLGGLSATMRAGGMSQGFGAGHGRLGGSHKTTPPRRASAASGTNNQISGVDEADIVKNDGRYVYLALNGALRILEALRPRALSVTPLPGRVKDLFIDGDRAVVYTSDGGDGSPSCTYGYDCRFVGDGSSTRILVFDVRERSAPRLMRSIELSGSLITARRIGHAVHTVVSDRDSATPDYATWPEGLERCGVKEAYVKRRLTQLARENAAKIRAQSWFPTLRDGGTEQKLCDRALAGAIDDGDAYTSLISFDATNDRTPPVTVTLKTRPGAVFASTDALYLTATHQRAARAPLRRGRHWYDFYRSVDEVSDVHKFRIGQQPAETHYVGSGVVPGHVLNQFSMDQYYGYLRIATTRGRVPNPNTSSVVSTLAESAEGNLVRVGAIENIAPGEDIRSVRFDEDRGYVVTFKKTDPLFVLDLSSPDRPRILGELKIPGFSTYMHRLDPSHLLSIGFDADDRGRFAFFDGLLLQLFDVSTPTDPKLLFRERIGTRGSSSEAATDHLAFNYFDEKGLLAIPMTVCEGGGEGHYGNRASFNGLYVYQVSLTGGFTRLGGVDHGTNGASCSSFWSHSTSTVKRSIFLDDLVYSIATDRVKVQKLQTLGTDFVDIALGP